MLPQAAGRPGVQDGRMRQHEPAWVGLGANVGAPRASLERAVRALSTLPETSLEGVSRLYRTRPVGPVAQADFHNAVAALRVPAGASPEDGALALLVALKGLERTLGRVERERWGPREIDLDLLLFGAHALRVERAGASRSEDPGRGGTQWLEVPHPSAQERLFVLAPLADLAPDLRAARAGARRSSRRATACAGPPRRTRSGPSGPGTHRAAAGQARRPEPAGCGARPSAAWPRAVPLRGRASALPGRVAALPRPAAHSLGASVSSDVGRSKSRAAVTAGPRLPTRARLSRPGHDPARHPVQSVASGMNDRRRGRLKHDGHGVRLPPRLAAPP